tara:strand:- start:10131 stop:11417 length:1287 start_codon:yes stop_codon:yes gene_type:complete
MKINNSIKFIIIGLIITICLCILYFCNITIIEGLNNIDCSSCEVKPSTGNCIQIKEISYNNFGNNIQDIDFDIVDTSYIFCPWTPNCNSNYNVQCCPNDNFYNNNTININTLPQVTHIKHMCERINNSNNLINIRNRVGDDYLKLRSLCNQPDLSGLYFNREIKFSGNVLKNPDLTIQEIIDYQNILEIKLINTGGETKRNQDITLLNDELKRLNLNNQNDRIRKQEIQNNLADNFFISTISDETYQFNLINVNGTPIGTSYILQENEFFDCYGNNKTQITIKDMSFNQTDLQKFESENYFGVDSNAQYTTMQDNTQRLYPNRQDFEMELKNLPPIKESTNVSTGIIKTYLNSINNFYEKQISNMSGPRTHAFPQSLQFDNNSLQNKKNTFFVYDASFNNNFECEPSITGNDNFKYCGPSSYYTDVKF